MPRKKIKGQRREIKDADSVEEKVKCMREKKCMRRYFTCGGGKSRITGRKKGTKAKEGQKVKGRNEGAESAQVQIKILRKNKSEDEKG